MEETYDTLFDFCQDASRLPPDSNEHWSGKIHDEPLQMHIYVRLDVHITKDTDLKSLFVLNTAVDQPTQVLICKKLTIDADAALTTLYRCKGLIIWAVSIINNGVITMTKRGCIAAGQNLFLYKNKDDSYEYVPKTSGVPGQGYSLSASMWAQTYGYSATKTAKRGTGAGGSGAGRIYVCSITIQRGGFGTSFCGGAGSGAGTTDRGSQPWPSAGSDIGGAGGNGADGRGNPWPRIATGGAGNPAGYTAYWNNGASRLISDGVGAGGLLLIYCADLVNNGTISSEGSPGVVVQPTTAEGTMCTGGSSGGGSINIFYTKIVEGTLTAKGGRSIEHKNIPNCNSFYGGGNGGDGSVTLQQFNFPAAKTFVFERQKFKYFDGLWRILE